MPIHVQVISSGYEEAIKKLYIYLRKNVYVKIPVTKNGLKVMEELKSIMWK